MRYVITALFFLSMMTVHRGFGQFQDSKIYPVYHGNDLGLTYTPQKSSFKIWSPTADAARITFYGSSLGSDIVSTHLMQQSEGGIMYFRFWSMVSG
jgi:pullulanase